MSREIYRVITFPAMSYQSIHIETVDRIATITIDRPDKLNALNDATIAELGEGVEQVRADAGVGGVILTGAGRAFVAGADISELADQKPNEARARALRGQAVYRRIESSPKPFIAAVNGFALGGGCELALACHMRIASETAKFGQPEVKLGLLPGYGGTQRLARLVGRGLALELLLTGETVGAADAYRLGIANRVTPPTELMHVARAMMTQILANGPVAVAMCLDAVDRGLSLPLDDGLALEASYFGLLAATSDAHEGTRAFLEKRAAHFTGK
jgi:enoyl-CoA hydratase